MRNRLPVRSSQVVRNAMHGGSMSRLSLAVTLVAALLLSAAPAADAAGMRTVVDGVTVTVHLARAGLHPTTVVTAPNPGDANQQATAVDPATGTTLSILAVPYGFRASELFSDPAASPLAAKASSG